MNKELETLHRLSKAIAHAAKLEEIYEIILDELVEVMGVERASILRYDAKAQLLRIVAARGIDKEVWKTIEISVGEGVSGRVFSEGKPLLIKGFKGSDRYKTHSYLVAPVCFPMKVGDLPIGIINLTDKKSGEAFTESDLKLLTTLSDQAASYMHLCDLMDQLKIAEHAKLQLEMAREIQQKLLPQKPPHIKGVDVAGVLIPAERVGADYYDYLVPNGETLSLAIADVSGHNVGGALLASAFRACLRMEIQRTKKTADIVSAVNKNLFADLAQAEQFISFFLAQYQPQTKTLFFTNAGHNPPLLWRTRKKAPEWLFTQDSLIGIEPDSPYHEKKCQMEKDDLLILYTDGLTEAANGHSERFGSGRLLKAIEEGPQQSAAAVLEHLLKTWKRFIGPKPPQDDMTLVVLKIS